MPISKSRGESRAKSRKESRNKSKESRDKSRESRDKSKESRESRDKSKESRDKSSKSSDESSENTNLYSSLCVSLNKEVQQRDILYSLIRSHYFLCKSFNMLIDDERTDGTETG